MQTIRQYLAGHGFNRVDINYLWSMENRTVCVSFILPDKNLAIRYTDPNTIGSLATTARKNTCKQQEQVWEAFAKNFKAAGGAVYSIDASTADQIVAALDGCRTLRPINNTATETTQLGSV